MALIIPTVTISGDTVEEVAKNVETARTEQSRLKALSKQRQSELGSPFSERAFVTDLVNPLGADPAQQQERQRVEFLTKQRAREKSRQAGGQLDTILTQRSSQTRSLLSGL